MLLLAYISNGTNYYLNRKTILTTTQFDIKKANRFLPYILLVGLGIGTANYIMNDSLNWIQWVIQSLFTSLLIGFTTVLMVINKEFLKLKYILSGHYTLCYL